MGVATRVSTSSDDVEVTVQTRGRSHKDFTLEVRGDSGYFIVNDTESTAIVGFTFNQIRNLRDAVETAITAHNRMKQDEMRGNK